MCAYYMYVSDRGGEAYVHFQYVIHCDLHELQHRKAESNTVVIVSDE